MKLNTVVAVAAGTIIGAGALYMVLRRKDVKDWAADVVAGTLVRITPMLDDPTVDEDDAPVTHVGWNYSGTTDADHAPSLG